MAKAAADLDEDIRRFMDRLAADSSYFPDPHAVPYPESRRFVESVRLRWTDGGPAMASTSELEAPSRHGPVRLRLHDPGGPRKPALVYLHGGGWTFFSLDTHDRLMREYAARAGIAVVGVDYALSPEAKYPVAFEQVVDTLRWLRGSGDALGLDPTRIALGGDSAGANLSVAAALSLRDAGEPALVRAMLLNYGAYDAHCSEAARRYGGPGYMLGTEEMATFWSNYIRAGDDLDDPLVCPLRADLAGLPPAFVVIPECDLLTEQNQMMAVKLQAAGVPVRAQTYPGTSHSFLEAMSVAEVSRRAIDDSAAWLRRTLGWMEPKLPMHNRG